MPPSRSRGPTNLTAAVELMPWPEAREAVRALARVGGLTLEIRALDATAAEGERVPGGGDEVYVVIAGYGVLRCGEEAVEFTAGDVLLAPGGVAHRFERLDGEFRLWRISPERRAGP